jgi:hypothetical protein
MTTSPDPSADVSPRYLLPLRPASAGEPLADLLGSLVADLTADRRRRGLPDVRIELDVASDHMLPTEPAMIRAGLAPLLAAACDAAAASPAGRGPRLREVLITSVATAAGLELEVADSGPGPAGIPAAAVAAARLFAGRCGGDVLLAACPEGGAAVTLRLPRRRRQSRAA